MSEKQLPCLSMRFVSVVLQYFLSDGGGAVAIFRDELLVLNIVDKPRRC